MNLVSILQGRLDALQLGSVETSTNTMFQDQTLGYSCRESYLIDQMELIPKDELLSLCKVVYSREVQYPKVEYISPDIIAHFQEYHCIPFRYDTTEDTIYVGVLPEEKGKGIKPFGLKSLRVVEVPFYWFVENYIRLYGYPKYMKRLPARNLFQFIIKEATDLGAADITISQRAKSSQVYYNVRKRIVQSSRKVDKEDVDSIIEYALDICNKRFAINYTEPIYFKIDLDQHNRGRCVVTKSYHGLKLTIRVLPNDLFETRLEDLNLKDNTINFCRDKVLNFNEKGLRLMVGPTYSGKNTTIASLLYELNHDNRYCGISVEQPVELLMDFLEQHDCDTDEDYEKVVSSLLRQNPDFVYATEMTDRTAKEIMNVSNTGKVVFSSVHANTLAEVPARLQDLTGLSIDRCLLNLNSIIYQELVRDDKGDRIYPMNRCIYFDDELKSKLFGKSVGEVYKILKEVEQKWQT